MEREALSWHIAQSNGQTMVAFSGVLDERSDLQTMPPLSGNVEFDLGGIRRVTSGGVTQWIRFIANLAEVAELTFVQCSVPVVGQLNMVRGFCGKAVVRSFYAPYLCEDTGEETYVLLKTDQLADLDHPPEFPSGQGKLVLNDIPHRYFAFLASRP